MRCIPGQAQSRGHNGNFLHKVREKPRGRRWLLPYLPLHQPIPDELLDDVGRRRAVLRHRDFQVLDETLVLARRRGATTSPRDAEWSERFFHTDDPDGHELSFARPLRSSNY